MNLSELRDEVVGASLRDYTNDSIVDAWINRAIREIENPQPWPWRIKTTTVSSPYSIPDLAQVYKITCDGQTVDYQDFRNVIDYDPDQSETGQPLYWFMYGNQLDVWPATDKQLVVVYLRTPQTLSADGDEPEIPEPFHELIVTGARIRGFRHTQSFEAAALERSEWQAGMNELLVAYGHRNYDTDQMIQRKGYPGDY